MRRILIVLATLLVVASVLLVLNAGRLRRLAYEGFGGREDWQQPDAVVASLGIQPGDRVADIGAGGGYFSFRLADAVGADGTLYAVDVDEDMTGYLAERAQREGYGNVQIVLGRFEDPLLPDGAIDLVFLSNTYHHIEDAPQYVSGVRADLAAEGRVAIIDYREGGWWPPGQHWMEREVIERDMQAAGSRLETHHDFLAKQHFLIFRVAGD